MSYIDFENVRKVYKSGEVEIEALHDVSFSVEKGELCVIVGPSGAGKTTLLNILGGMDGLTSGRILLDGENISALKKARLVGYRRQDIGFVFQFYNLIENLTALENLSGSLIPKAGKHLIRRQLVNSVLEEASRWFDREELQKRIRDWPLPERLRLAYYKWYLIHPRLLICLFPFLGQESLYHEQIIDLLVLCARRGMAVLIVSSAIDTICEKTRNPEFLRRLRYLD